MTKKIKAKIKFICFSIRYYVSKWDIEFNYFKINKNKDIFLGQNVHVNKSAIIDTKNGGKIEIGNNTEILDGVIIQTYGGNIKIGKNCSINAYSILYGHGGLTIGDDVLIAGHCMIIPSNHIFIDINKPIREQGGFHKGIVIENDVWISHGCSILDNVTISNGAIIAAGSVVNKNVQKLNIVGGVPAKKIKKR